MTSFYQLLLAALALLASLSLQAADEVIQITGQVTGEDNDEGLPGVTIVVKGSSTGTVSDIDGNYSISADEDAVLIFSFVGFTTAEVPVNGRAIVDVALAVDEQQLDEVVVVGYGEQKKANLTGAVTTVKPEQFEDIPVGNFSLALVNKLAGVQVDRNGTGIPGTPSPLVIRAESASGMQRQVVYVIDGVIYTGEQDGTGPSGDEVFNRLDPSEIESISILKDAAAAVYGARGAGGVVLVKTKRGRAGKLKVNYNGSFGIGQPTQIPEMLTGEQHAMMYNEILRIRREATGQRPPAGEDFNDNELALIRQRNYNWLDGLYKAAMTNRHSLNLSGGTESIRYFVAGNYYHETGNYDDLWYKRYGIRSNVESDLTKNLQLGLSMSMNEGIRKNPNYDPGGNVGEGVLREFYKRPLTAPRWIPPTINGLPVNTNLGTGSSWNPHGLLQSDNQKTNNSNNTNLSARLNYNVPFVEGLKLSSLLSYNINTSVNNTFNQNYDVYNFISSNLEILDTENPSRIEVENSERIREEFNKGTNYQFNISANYARSLGGHTFNATLVYEQADGQSRGFNVEKTGADIRGLNYLWAYSNSNVTTNGLYELLGRWGVIGRLNYDYKNKYLFESAFRSESSNKFAPEYRRGIFPAVSAGWVISEEPFFKDNISFINFLKFRTSIGIVGNDNVRPFQWKPSFNADRTGAIFGEGEGSLSNAIEARNNGFTVPSRTWAKTRTYNAGIDVALLNNKLDLTAEYYYAFTYDGFLTNKNVPWIIGNASPPDENYKESMSTGLEFQLGYKDQIGSDIQYSINANFTKRRSRPLKLYQNPSVIGTWRDELRNDDSNQPGYIALGIIRTDEDLERVQAMYSTIPTNGFDLPVAKGMIYYADIAGPDGPGPDGKLDGNDQTIIAEYTTPPYSYGMGFSFSYKGWRLNASFGGVFGHKEFINKDEQVVDTETNSVVTSDASTFSWWGDYWTEEDPDAAMPRPAFYGFDAQHSTFWMRDGHSLRMNDMTVSYTMPQSFMKRLQLSNFRFYASATNVWTIISPFDYKDPAVSRAFDYPLVRTISLGMSFSI